MMNTHDLEVLAIAIISIGGIWYGARGIAQEGRDLKSKSSRRIDVMLSVSQLVSGLMGLGFVAYWLLR